MHSSKKILHNIIWIILTIYSVFITLIFAFFASTIFIFPEGNKMISEWFTIKPGGIQRVTKCVTERTIYQNKDINTVFFKHKDSLDTLKEIGGGNTGFELALNSWDDHWGCLTGSIDVSVVDYNPENKELMNEFIQSEKLPFKITLDENSLSALTPHPTK